MNSMHTPVSRDFKFQLNPNAKEFVPASSSSARGSARRQEPLVIKDQESDKAFHQRLKESRDFWDLEEVPSYKKLKCATCYLNRYPKNDTEMLKELTHDVVNLVAYYHECQDKDKEYECKYCVDKFNGVVDPEDERYACNDSECGCDDCEKARCDYSSDEDYSFEDEDEDENEEDDDEDPEDRRERMKLERKRENAYKKRNQREHMKHLKEEHEKKLRIIFYFKQDFIPLCDDGLSGFWGNGNCEWGFHEILDCMDLNKGHKFLHMEEPPRPRSPGSPKAWQYMMGMADDHYFAYNYDNKWDSDSDSDY